MDIFRKDLSKLWEKTEAASLHMLVVYVQYVENNKCGHPTARRRSNVCSLSIVVKILKFI